MSPRSHLICFYINEDKEVIRKRQPSHLCPQSRQSNALAKYGESGVALSFDQMHLLTHYLKSITTEK
jgi:hypothetical protein